MIGSLIKGGGFRGVLDYVLGDRDHDGKVREVVEPIGGTVTGSAQAMAAQFAVFRQLRPSMAKPVDHQILRWATGRGDSLDREQQGRLAARWAEEVGYDAWTAVSHGDHLHLVGCRIKADGSVISDAWDWKRNERLVQRLEPEFGLVQTERSYLVEPERAATHKKAPNMKQIGMLERTGQVPPSQIVATVIDQAVERGATVSELVEELDAHGVDVLPNLASTGRVNGLAYEIDGQAVTAKAMGRGYTWSNLQKRGLSYVEDRDLPRLCRCVSERAERGLGADEPHRADAGGPGRGVDSCRSGNDPAVGRDAEQPEEARAAERPTVEDLGPGAGGPGGGAPGGPGGGEGAGAGGRGREGAERVVPVDGPRGFARFAVADDVADGAELGESADRLVSLAGGKQSRARRAIEAMLEALPAEHYEIGVGRHSGAGMQRRRFTPDQLRRSVGWLARQNAQGLDIYARPEDTRYVLLDDVTAEAVDAMKRDGFAPSLVVETSKGNRQAWVDLGETLEPEPRTEAGRMLAQRYGADPASVDHRHFGRLPGYRNKKPERDDGRGVGPEVRVEPGFGQRVAQRAGELVQAVKAWWQDRQVQAEQERRLEAVQTQPQGQSAGALYAASVRRQLSQLEEQGQAPDWSRVDFKAAQWLAVKGIGLAEIAATVAERSPGVDARKHDPQDYGQRTAAAADSSRWVQEQRLAERLEARQARQAPQRPSGPSLSR